MSRNVFVIIEELSAGIQELKQALAPLSALTGPTTRSSSNRKSRGTQGKKKTGPKPVAATRPTKTKTASSKRTPGQVLHTRYMNALKNLNAGDQARVKKLRVTGGAEAAVKLATSLTK